MTKLLRNFWWVVLGVAVGVAVGYYLTRQRKQLPAPSSAPIRPPIPLDRVPSREPARPPAAAKPEPPSEAEAPAPAPAGEDNLTRIDGIGPAYARALNELGIRTFAQLAQADPEALAAQIDRLTADRIRRDDWLGQAAALSKTRKA
ncbi:MAG: DUF4332 domain-containing protein [Anaerolineae bacterium]|nr:DUF4332 domain-containing protein [Anaerolineae bacterium]